jgi:AcrR family transcriptional regulator
MSRVFGEYARPPRGDRREKTRARLIEAASELIREHGYEAFTLESVASRAGVTRRTIYDHFRNKDDLIVAVISRRRAQQFPAVEPSQSLPAYLRALARAVIKMSADNPGLGRSTASFELYALAHEDMRKRVLARNREIYPRIEASLVAAFGRNGLGMPPRRFVRVMHALIDGMLARRHLMPEEFTDDVVIAAFEALAPKSRDG